MTIPYSFFTIVKLDYMNMTVFWDAELKAIKVRYIFTVYEKMLLNRFLMTYMFYPCQPHMNPFTEALSPIHLSVFG